MGLGHHGFWVSGSGGDPRRCISNHSHLMLMLLVLDHTFRPGLAEAQNLQSNCEKEHGISLRNLGTSPDLPLTHCVGRKVQYLWCPIGLPGKRNRVSLLMRSNEGQKKKWVNSNFEKLETTLEEQHHGSTIQAAYEFIWDDNLTSQVALVVKNPPANAGDISMGSIPGKIPWRREQQLTPVFLPGQSYGQRNLVGYSPCGCKRVGHDLACRHTNLTASGNAQIRGSARCFRKRSAFEPEVSVK